MSLVEEIVCRGAPRDLGLDQGVAGREGVRREVRRAGAADGEQTRRIARDVRRFFPHTAERAEGLALGAQVSEARLAQLLGRELSLEGSAVRRATSGLALAIAPERSGAGALVGRSLDLPRESPPGLRVRRSLPENDYRSVEIVLPWLVSPVAGVNEHGLAATVTSVPPAGGALEDCLAPASLLVQDCLQRFDRVDKAVEWCERRPAGGSASIVLADARGAVASVHVDGRVRRRRSPGQGVVVGLGRSLRCSTAEKVCLAADPCDVESLLALLRSHDGTLRGDDDSTCRHGEDQETAGLVILDPAEGRMLFLDETPCRAGPRSERWVAA